MMLRVTTIRKFTELADNGSVRRWACLLLPYLSCLLFVEIYHLMISVFLVYGKFAGVPLGVGLSAGLCAAVIAVFFGSSKAGTGLLLAYDLHIAITVAMLIRIVLGYPSGVPSWVFIYRTVLLVWEVPSVCLLSGKRSGQFQKL